MKKILIVDDNPQIRELLVVTLQDNDAYQVLAAENSQQALQLSQREHPHLMLLDIKLVGSDIDGLEVCRRLKQDPTTADIIIILLSGTGQQHDMEVGRAVGADDYLAKPFSPTALMAKIETILGEARARF